MPTLGHRMIDDSINNLKSISDRPVWQVVPEAVKEAFKTEVPEESTDPDQVYDDFDVLVEQTNRIGQTLVN